MKPGEIAVWAAEFVRRRSIGSTGPEACCWAARAVEAMNNAPDSTLLDPPARRMLEDILGQDGAR